MRFIALLVGVLLASLPAGCLVEEDDAGCAAPADCPVDLPVCSEGRCTAATPPAPDAAAADAAPVDVGPDATPPAPDAAPPAADAAPADAAPDAAPPDAAPEPCVPAPETCDGLDDDCDGLTDEDTDEPCYSGPRGTERQGACRAGVRHCRDGVPARTCAGEVTPVLEACDNEVDDDCDGAVDEGCGCPPEEVRPCGLDVGACVAGRQACIDGVWGRCEGAVGPADETCDGTDEDCDGATDERLAQACYDGDPRTEGVGACRAGRRACAGGVFPEACEGQVLPEARDDCDGVDSDCDGTVDEDFVPQATRCGLGLCAAEGMRVCRDGAVVDTCQPGAPAALDRCDGRDEDCDGRVDEGHVVAATACGVGICAAAGERLCTNGVQTDTCTPGQPAVEVHNDLDDDCDGFADEGFPYRQAQIQARFDRECGGCHGNSGGLTLRGDFTVHTVNVPALGAGMVLVTPGDHRNSYLYHKLAGTQRQAGGGGSRMPVGGPNWDAYALLRFALWIDALDD